MPKTNIFTSNILPPDTLKISYLPSAHMYKLDYIHTDEFASIDVTKTYEGIIASLFIRKSQLNNIDTFTDPLKLAEFLKEIKLWIDEEQSTPQHDADEPSFGIPTPSWD